MTDRVRIEDSELKKQLDKVEWPIEYGTVMVQLRNGKPTLVKICLLYTSPSPRDRQRSRMPSSA